MKVIWFLIYNIVGIPIQYFGFHLAGLFSKKIRQGISGRKREHASLDRYQTMRDGASRCYMVHCASLGEYEMARPIIEKIQEEKPEICIVLTFFSPSGYEQVKESAPADVVTYLPFDSVPKLSDFFTRLRPEKLILTSYEVWPNLIWVSKRFGVEVYLTSARLSDTSNKTLPLVRSLFRAVYSDIPHIYPITDTDEQNLRRYFHLENTVDMMIFGNTRYDRVFGRSQEAQKTHHLPQQFQHQPTVIAGSIWPADTKVIFPAFTSLLKEYPELQIVCAPHEISREHVDQIEEWCERNSIPYTLLSEYNSNDVRVLIVDEIGHLAEIYHDGDIAFVGGGFSGSVHNVMEPAVAHCAVFFGPEHQNSDEAVQLIEHAGGAAITSPDEVYQNLAHLLDHESDLQSMQAAAFHVIVENTGATDKTVQRILQTEA